MVEEKTVDLTHAIRRCPECGQQYSADSVFCPFDGTKLELARFDPTTDPLLGKTVDDRYVIESILGEGGMGTVYEARHTALRRSFAMKVLRRDLARDEELSARFIQEAKATAAIRHPHIVAINDFGNLEDGRPYFVMELLSGKPLSDLIKLGPIPPLRGARILSKVARGLAAAHAAGVIHRDLKPENIILISSEGEDDVRVVDFGAAILQGQARLTKAGVVFGTPHYMSPEQASGQKVDLRADIYSLGVIMYEMFTSRLPFEGDTYMGVLTQHIYVQPTPPSKLVDRTNLGALESVILRALEKRPADRFQTMDELEQATLRVLRTRDGVTEIAPAEPRARKPALADQASVPTLDEIRSAAEPPRSRRGLGWIALGIIGIPALSILSAILVNRMLGAKPEPVTAAMSTSPPPNDAAAPIIEPLASSTPLPVVASTVPKKPDAPTHATDVVKPKPKPTGEFADPWK